MANKVQVVPAVGGHSSEGELRVELIWEMRAENGMVTLGKVSSTPFKMGWRREGGCGVSRGRREEDALCGQSLVTTRVTWR